LRCSGQPLGQRAGLGRLSFSYAGFGIGVEGKVEQSLKTTLMISTESERLIENTLEIMVPPRLRLTVLLHWKQAWEEGEVEVQLPDGTLAEIPYRAAIEIPRFDQQNIEG
jgi:hypothetical protein